MASNLNQHNLSREIPADVKRAVRQRDGFGCIICGGAIVDYEHFEPEFVDAKSHDPDGIILLCPNHHRKKGGLLSRERIERARLSPKAREQRFSREAFDLGSNHVTLQLGTLAFHDVTHAIVIEADPVFSVLPPEQTGGPYRINAQMTDVDGAEVLRIVDNEIQSPTRNWDVKVTATKVEILRGHRDVVLRMRTDAPGALVVERLEMVHRGLSISVREGQPAIFQSENTKCRASMQGVAIRGFEVGLSFNNGTIGMGSDYATAVARSIVSSAAMNGR